MNFPRRQLFKHLAQLFDLGVLSGSFVFAAVAVYSSPAGLTLNRLMSVSVTLGHGLLFAFLLVIWHNTFALCGLYNSQRLTPLRVEISEIFKAVFLASVLLFLSAKVFHIAIVKLSFVAAFWFCFGFFMASGRHLVRQLLLMLRSRGTNSRCVLIIGTNKRAIKFADQITSRPELGYRIVGFIDDDWEGIQEFEATGHMRCCDFRGLADFLRHNVVDEVAIYLPMKSYYGHAAQLVSQCEHHGIALRFNSQSFNVRGRQVQAQDLDEHSHVLSVTASSEVWPALVKTIIDYAVSIVLLALTAPLLLLVALLIKLTSSGPVLFCQVRVGVNKRQFGMYKFRTMIEGAEQMQEELLAMNEMTGPAFKITNDPRVTPVGRFLRKTSIDELPQLLNVLKGDMSLVGPRAMSLRDYQRFNQDWQRRRFSVTPGITCLWQVKGRNSVPFETWMELDMQYIDKWSLWLDLKILLQTVPAIIRRTGAV